MFLLVVLIIGLIPFAGIYLLAEVMFGLSFYLVGYRKKVILQNLSIAFPGNSLMENERVMKGFYRNFSDIMVEAMKAFAMSRNQINKRYVITNPEVLNDFYEKGQSVIAVTGHLANWEWGSLAASLQCKHKVVAFYKPLSNTHIDRFLKWNRSRFGTTLASIYETSKTFEYYKETPSVFLMVADQSPHVGKRDSAIWANFFDRETAFLHGMEKHARNNNYPVIFIEIARVKRGFYEVILSPLADNVQQLAEGEITRRFAAQLESVIRKKPENWLWSHRRWKIER